MSTIESLSADIAALNKDVKSLSKLVRKVRSHQEDPTGEKAKSRTRNNGFNRKMEVSDTLKEFLSLEQDGVVSRSDVTRKINAYIKENDLKHPDNGRVIVLDEKLSKLLTPPDGEQVTFLNIQKYISPHYLKAAEVPEVPDEVSPEVSEDSSPEESAEPAKKVTKRPKVSKPKA